MIQYLTLLLAIPLGHLLSKLTPREKEIYTKPQYFPAITKILIILMATFIFKNPQTFLTLTFLLITILTWQKS